MGSQFDDQLTKDLGLVTLAFLSDWRWVERRVESVTFPDEITVRRRVSVDFAVPESFVSPLPRKPGGLPTFFTPLAVLRKQGLVRFDLRDEAGKALPLLTREENGLLAQATLVQLAEAINADRGHPVAGDFPAELHEELSLITNGPADSALVVWNALEKAKGDDESDNCRTWRRFLTRERKFMSLAQDFAVAFPLIVPVTAEVGTRRIIKFSYQASAPERRPSSRRRQLSRGIGWHPRTERIQAPSIGQGRCYHLEVQAPDGLQITRGALSPSARPRPSVWHKALPDVIKPGSERVHMHLAAPGTAEGRALVNLRARPSTISRAALATAILTTLALVIAFLQHDVLQENLGPTVSLLLLVPTALSVYVARPREPVVTTGLLLGQRMLAVGCGILAIGASTLLVAGQNCNVTGEVTTCQQWSATPWFIAALGVGAGLISIILTATVILTSRPPEKMSIES